MEKTYIKFQFYLMAIYVKKKEKSIFYLLLQYSDFARYDVTFVLKLFKLCDVIIIWKKLQKKKTQKKKKKERRAPGGPNRYHFLCIILLPAKLIAKSFS